MTASLRAYVCVLVLSLFAPLARAETECRLAAEPTPYCSKVIDLVEDRSSANTNEAGTSLRQDLFTAYDALKAREKGIFNEDVSAIATKHLLAGSSLQEIKLILEAAKLEKLLEYKGRIDEPDISEIYVSKSPIVKGFSGGVYVTFVLYFSSNDGRLLLQHMTARMNGEYL